MAVKVTSEVIKAIRAAAGAAHPHEACGLLLGEGARITEFRETANVHPNPQTHFEIEPQALIAAHRSARDGGDQVLGYFHSHPRGPAEPSSTDQAAAARDGRIWAITAGEELRLWRDGREGFEELSYSTVEQ